MGGKVVEAPAHYRAPGSLIERFACQLLFGMMIRDARIAVDYGTNEIAHGAEFVVACPRLWPAIKIAVAPNLYVGETYVSGDWFLRSGNLSDFIALLRTNPPRVYGAYYRFVTRFRGIRFYVEQYLLNRYFTRRVRNHYDVDSAIYELILDEDLVYTCGFFESAVDPLSTAQQNKISAVIRRMHLPTEGAKVLDIGCGWGASERFLVHQYPNATVCGLTISGNQISWARNRDLGSLTESQRARIEYRLEDYTAHEQRDYYDGVCVIGMMEHVGLGGYEEFFQLIHDVLKPGGNAVVHTIVSPTSQVPSNRWMDKHIFVGGYAPSVSEISRAIEHVPLRLTGAYLYSPIHYRTTIERWLGNLTANRQRMIDYMRSRSGSAEDAERTYRTWHFYLSGVRNMFDLNTQPVHQVAHICVSKEL